VKPRRGEVRYPGESTDRFYCPAIVSSMLASRVTYVETRVSVEHSFRWECFSWGPSTFVSNKWGMTVWKGESTVAYVEQCYCMRVEEPRDCNESRTNFARWWMLQERFNMRLRGMPKIFRCVNRRQFERRNTISRIQNSMYL